MKFVPLTVGQDACESDYFLIQRPVEHPRCVDESTERYELTWQGSVEPFDRIESGKGRANIAPSR